jgi:sigma-B regulation protein RsbU (phosphoserine phosphatase)
MGHGVRAGLLTALIRGVVEEFAPRSTAPALVLAEINRGLMPIIRQTGQPVFATVFYGVIDTEAATICYANGGHPPPLVVEGDTTAVTALGWPSPEPAAGLIEEFVYSSRTLPFKAGDKLLAYTDGFMEASNADGVMFGQARLSQFLSARPALSGHQIMVQLVQEIIAFSGRNAFDDDLCAVVIESTGQSCTLQPGFTYHI